MNLAQSFPYNMELSDNESQDYDPVMIYLATGFAFVSLLLVTISCLCCSGGDGYSGSRGLYEKEGDTATLADLLSKPPLADPESVFSELSYDGRVSGAYNSWTMVPSDDGSSGLERMPSVMHYQPQGDPSRRSFSVKVNMATEPSASSTANKKWSSEKHRVNKATRLQREKEKEAKFQSQGVHRGDKTLLLTVKASDREKESHLQTIKDNDREKESHHSSTKDHDREKESHAQTIKENDSKKEGHVPTIRDNGHEKESHVPTIRDNGHEKESHVPAIRDNGHEKESHAQTIKENDREKKSHVPTIKDNDLEKESHVPNIKENNHEKESHVQTIKENATEKKNQVLTIQKDNIENQEKQSSKPLSLCNESGTQKSTHREEEKVKMPHSPSGIDESGLKIHKVSPKPKTYAFSSITRCSFSHEAGHTANGSKLPRTSLPRTEENESQQSENRKLQVHSASASNIAKQISPNQAETGGSYYHRYGHHLDGHHMTKSNSDHVISYKATEKSGESTNNTENKIDKRVNLNALNNLRISSPATQNSQSGACAIPLSAVATIDNKAGFSEASDGKGVVMRRSFSQHEGDDPKRDRSDPAPKCFSLNLQINFHFGSDLGEGQISAECVPIVNGQSFSGDSKIEIHSNGRNLLTPNTAGQDENIKEKMLEDSFAAKKNNCKYLEIRKRFSEPASFSIENNLPTSRRYSVATSKPKERTCPRSTLAVHGAGKLSNLQKRKVETLEEGQGHGSESDTSSQMRSVAEVDLELEKLDGREDCIDDIKHDIQSRESEINTDLKVELRVTDQNADYDENLNNVSKVGTKLQRSKVIIGSPLPRLKGIRKSSIENPIDPRKLQIPLPVSVQTRDQQSLNVPEQGNVSENKTSGDSSKDFSVSSADCLPSVAIRAFEQGNSHGNKRKALVFEKFDTTAADVSNIEAKSEKQPNEAKPIKPVALPRRSLPQIKDAQTRRPTDTGQTEDKGKNENTASSQNSSDRAVIAESASGSRIPIMIVDDSDDEEEVAPGDYNGNKVFSKKNPEAKGKETNASDESDYDNPWDDLDDAVKRASIRYNRRPSRVAIGEQTLFLKSAEDLGRLLEEAEKKRKLRKESNNSQMSSPEEENPEDVIIPFTRLSPYRHTVKGILKHQTVASHSQSTEDILARDPSHSPSVDTSLPGDMRDKTKRPQSMTVKSKSEIPLSERKRHKY